MREGGRTAGSLPWCSRDLEELLCRWQKWGIWGWLLTDVESWKPELSIRPSTVLRHLYPCIFSSKEEGHKTLRPWIPLGERWERDYQFYHHPKQRLVDRRRFHAGGAETVNPVRFQSLLNSANKNKRVSARLLKEAMKGDTVSLIPCCHSLNTSSRLLIFTPSFGGHQATSWEVLTMAEDGRRCLRSAWISKNKGLGTVIRSCVKNAC